MRLLILAGLLATLPALADVADEKLGADYTDAEPPMKLALLSVAKADKALTTQETSAAHRNVVLAVVAAGENAEAQLRLHGELRTSATALLKEINVTRKANGARNASFVEPDMSLQQALASAYLAESAGAQPSLDAIGGLALVRECTSWASTTSLVHAHACEALNRDAAYREADLEGKLAIIKQLAEDRQMLSDHERTLLEKPLLSDHISAAVAAGTASATVASEIDGLKRRNLICFFSSSWAKKIVDGLEALGR